MKEKKYPLSRTYKEAPDMEISFFTRYTAMEACFGNAREDEENLAYSILKSIKKVTQFPIRVSNVNHVVEYGQSSEGMSKHHSLWGFLYGARV